MSEQHAWLWVASLALMPLAHAQDNDLAEGRKLYEKECIACHGENTSADSRGRSPAVRLAHAGHGAHMTDAGSELRFHIQLAVAPPFGPNLRGIIGRPAGSVEGFEYSEPFVKNLKGLVWDEGSLDVWLTSTQRWVKGVTMYYTQKNADIRRKIIAYLKANS